MAEREHSGNPHGLSDKGDPRHPYRGTVPAKVETAEIEALRVQVAQLHEALAKAEEALQVALAKLEEKHERLQDLAYHDSLTGLPNGMLLEETVADYVSVLAPLWLFRIKLHRMDRIRDTMGHHIGDAFLDRKSVV